MTTPVLRTARLVTSYRRYLSSADTPRFADEVARHYSTTTLIRLLGDGGVELRRAASLALGMLGDREAIEPLGRRLSDSDRGVRLAADDSFRGLLVRDAAPTHQHQLLQVMHLNDGGEFAAALSPALILADQAPAYAEAHHQLAICWLGLGDLCAAEYAYRSCLWQCRFHYPAWVGFAHTRLNLDEPTDEDMHVGLGALRRALGICPDLESARLEVRSWERSLDAGQAERLDDSMLGDSLLGDDYFGDEFSEEDWFDDEANRDGE